MSDQNTTALGFVQAKQTDLDDNKSQDILLVVALNQDKEKVILSKVGTSTFIGRTESGAPTIEGAFKVWIADYTTKANGGKVAKALADFVGGDPTYRATKNHNKAWSVKDGMFTLTDVYVKGDNKRSVEITASYADILKGIAESVVFDSMDALSAKVYDLAPGVITASGGKTTKAKATVGAC